MNGLRPNLARATQAATVPTRRPMRTARTAMLRTLSLCFAAGVPALAAAQGGCPPPPVVPEALLAPSTNWTTMQAFMNDNGIRFVATSPPQEVSPCKTTGGGSCVPMLGQVLSEQRAFCLTKEMAGDGQVRFAGAALRISGGSASQLVHLGFGGQNASDSVYLLVQGDQSIAMFRGVNRKVVVIRQNVARDSGWLFVFHPETGSFPGPEAQWRPDTTHLGMARPRVRPPVHGGGPTDLLPADEGGDAQGGTSFAWMACAAGCCQFHGLPAGSGDPGDGENGPPRGHQPNPNPGPPHHRGMSVTKDRAPAAP